MCHFLWCWTYETRQVTAKCPALWPNIASYFGGFMEEVKLKILRDNYGESWNIKRTLLTLWGVRFSAPFQTSPGAHPAYCTMGTRSFPGVKSGRGVTQTPQPLLVPWSWKGRAIPLLPLWVVRSVQSLSACSRVTFTLPFYYWLQIYITFSE